MFGTGNELNRAISGIIEGNGDLLFHGLSIDSRQVNAGEVFIAIKGERFDGHDFVKEALEKGVAGVVIEKGKPFKVNKNQFIVYVNDTRKALGELAKYWRKKQNPKVIAITGSCGKTTTKELIYAICSTEYKTLKNHANLNNYFGVSLSLLNLRNEKFAIVETGINAKKEMFELANIIEPYGSVITNIAPVHLEGLSDLDTVFCEKKVLLDNTKKVVFANADDKRISNYKNKNVKIVWFGKKGDISFSNVNINDINDMSLLIKEKDTKRRLTIPYSSYGLVYNIAAAVSVGRYFGVSWDNIAKALETIKLPRMRMEVLKIGQVTVLLDAYNANPLSVRNAIETFLKYDAKKKAVVLGDMKELGKWSKYYHAMLGKFLLKCDFEKIFLVGDEIKVTLHILKKHKIKNVFYYQSVNDCKKDFHLLLKKVDAILIKGSRAVSLEKVLKEDYHAL